MKDEVAASHMSPKWVFTPGLPDQIYGGDPRHTKDKGKFAKSDGAHRSLTFKITSLESHKKVTYIITIYKSFIKKNSSI